MHKWFPIHWTNTHTHTNKWKSCVFVGDRGIRGTKSIWWSVNPPETYKYIKMQNVFVFHSCSSDESSCSSTFTPNRSNWYLYVHRKKAKSNNRWQHTKTIILQLYTYSHTCCNIQPTICSLCILSAKNNGSAFAAPAGSSRTSAVSFILWCNTDPYWMESGTTIWMKEKKEARIWQHAYS